MSIVYNPPPAGPLAYIRQTAITLVSSIIKMVLSAFSFMADVIYEVAEPKPIITMPGIGKVGYGDIFKVLFLYYTVSRNYIRWYEICILVAAFTLL